MKSLLFIFVLFNLTFTISVRGQTLYVDDFGAKGDGVTDDRDAIQSALDNLKSNGGELQFTSGKTYIIKTGLNFKYCSADKNYLITTTGSEKATIKIADGTPISWGHWGIFLHSSKNVTINNLHLDGNRDTRNPTEEKAGTYLIQIYDDCNGLRLNDLILENSVIDNVTITTTAPGDTTKYLSDFEMHNCVLRNGWRNNLSVIRGKNFKIIGCEFDNAQGLGDPEAGIDFEPNHGDGATSYGYKDILVEGCIFKNNRRFGITLTKHDDIEIEGRVTIRNNYFENNGIYLLSQYNVITNNVFRKVDHKPVVNSTGLEKTGIIIFSPWDEITGNKIYNNYFFDNPLPDEQHLIGLSSSTGANNEIYSNYSYNNNIEGFISNLSPNEQIIYDNIELPRKEMGYWNMDKDSISGSSIYDLSYFKQTGELANNPQIVSGKYNEALDFSPDNKYIEIPLKDNLDIETNLSISAWITWKGINSESEQVIVGRNDDWYFGLDNSGKAGFTCNSSSYTGGLIQAESPITTDKWEYVAVTYDGRYTRIYVDGKLSKEKESNGNLGISSSNLYIGSKAGEQYSFNGLIDDVKIYHYALSSSEIDSIYNVVSDRNKTMPNGSGTAEDPYQITSIVHFSWLAQTPQALGGYYKQMNDIDASVTAFWDDTDDNGDGDLYNDENDFTSAGANNGWLPIGNKTNKFSGNYNGSGYVIKGITIGNRLTNGNGFFGEVDNGKIDSLGLSLISIKGGDETGGLVSVCNNNSSISNCYTSGVLECIDGGSVGSGFGGLAGKLNSSTINRSYSNVNIVGSGTDNNQMIGGFVGSISGASSVSECYSLKNIESAGSISGGFVGSLDNSTISNSYSFGSVKSIENNASAGYGGFVGEVSGNSAIEFSYSIGPLDDKFSGQGFIGSVNGDNSTFRSNFFDKDLSGQESSMGAEAKSSEEMMNSGTFVSAGWDTTAIWKITGSYPNLRNNSNKDLEYGGIPGEIPGMKGSGSEDDPYQIARLSDLAWISQNNSAWGAYYIQTTDIDASITETWDDSDDNNDGNKYNDPNDYTMDGTNDGFLPIGSAIKVFSGKYDGGNYTINELHINRPDSKYIGFIGNIKSEAPNKGIVENLNLRNESIIGDAYIGGLAGKNMSGMISNCSTHGKVISNSTTGYIGGFIGYNIGTNDNKGEISKCSSAVEVNSTETGKYVGGFVGRNRSNGEIVKSCSKGNVKSAGDKVGGFAGQMAYGLISNCYSLASVTTTGSGVSVGGFCGAVYNAAIEYCYSVGENYGHKTKGFLGSESMQNVYTNNFLDTLASGCNQSAVPLAASGKTTAEMKTKSTFIGWDFENIWEISGDNYPTLNGVILSVKEIEKNVTAAKYMLEQNYPNPFNPTTKIRFTIPVAGRTILTIYNMLGQKVATVVDKELSAGSYQYNFNANDLSSGVYFYKLQSNSKMETKKMLLLR